MPALPADIAAASREVAISTWSDPAIAARYPAARDGSVTPATGYCDSAADADAIINARGVLIGVERRRFAVAVQDLVWPDPATGIPTVQLVDNEQRADGAFLVARVELDLDAETSSFELFG
ncbi:hypothetical protein U1737_04780 [Sphingomonas sp. LB3N6]|uniref:hypothetical protein n=1 Tax=Sphingomonas fucosidasi TaxID=3096164 RepID=UPI002FC96202